jgi:hypothetical protein
MTAAHKRKLVKALGQGTESTLGQGKAGGREGAVTELQLGIGGVIIVEIKRKGK